MIATKGKEATEGQENARSHKEILLRNTWYMEKTGKSIRQCSNVGVISSIGSIGTELRCSVSKGMRGQMVK